MQLFIVEEWLMADDAIGTWVFRGVFADAATAQASLEAWLRKRFATGEWAEKHPMHADARVQQEMRNWRVRDVCAGTINTDVEM